MKPVVREGNGAEFYVQGSTPNTDLAALSYRYAAAFDRRDLAAVLGVFHPQATLRAQPPGRNPMVFTAHAELAKLIAAVGHWPRTFHVVGQGLFHVDLDDATGEVYCVGHHFSSADPGAGDDYVMYLRYRDRYVRGADGRWLISERVVITDAVDRRDVGS